MLDSSQVFLLFLISFYLPCFWKLKSVSLFAMLSTISYDIVYWIDYLSSTTMMWFNYEVLDLYPKTISALSPVSPKLSDLTFTISVQSKLIMIISFHTYLFFMLSYKEIKSKCYKRYKNIPVLFVIYLSSIVAPVYILNGLSLEVYNNVCVDRRTVIVFPERYLINDIGIYVKLMCHELVYLLANYASAFGNEFLFILYFIKSYAIDKASALEHEVKFKALISRFDELSFKSYKDTSLLLKSVILAYGYELWRFIVVLSYIGTIILMAT